MLLNEIVIDITPELQNRKDAREQKAIENRSKERLVKLKQRRKDKTNSDEIGLRRRAKLNQVEQLRDIVRQLKNSPK